MLAATIRGVELVVEEHPDPEPGAGQVLVSVRAAGLNAADLMQVAGGYPAPPGSPQDIPGLELAGEASSVSGPCTTRFKVEGDRVMGLRRWRWSKHNWRSSHERVLMPVPDRL